MYYYTISIIVFILISAYIAYLIGRFSHQERMDKLIEDIDGLKKDNSEKLESFKELEEQLYHQSSVVKDMISSKEKLQNQIEEIERKKKSLATKGNELSSKIEDIISNETSKESLKSEVESLDREALRWKNKYTIANNELSNERIKIIGLREQDKLYIDEILSQKYQLIQQIEKNFLDFQHELHLIRNSEEISNNESQLVTDYELKVKRQENIIKALRVQLQNLNLQKIKAKRENNQLSNKAIDLVEDGVLEGELEEVDTELLEENNYSEILEEANQDIFDLFGKLKEFKAEKVRKTGAEKLSYSKINTRASEKVDSIESIASETKIEDDSYHESDNDEKGEEFELMHSDVLQDIFGIIGNKQEQEDKLTLIFNITRKTQEGLYQFGINSLSQISLLPKEHFSIVEKYLGLEENTIAEEKWVEQSRMLISPTDIRGIFFNAANSQENIQLEEEEANAFDLTIVKGIGKTYRTRLQNIGIEDINDLAKWREEEIDKLAGLLSIKSSLIIKQQWLKQARNKMAKSQ